MTGSLAGARSAPHAPVVVELRDGREVAFDLGPRGPGPACFVMGVRKSGSSILNRICHALAQQNGRRTVDVAGTFFKMNVAVHSWRRDEAVLELLRPGTIYAGFRDMPLVFRRSPVFRNGRKLLMVRDPRDALVSEYFSNAYSHSIPEKAEKSEVTDLLLRLRERALSHPIDEQVLEFANGMKMTLLDYKNSCDERTKIIRYEDVILSKKELIDTVCAHLGWTATPSGTEAILKWADERPESEDVTRFVRKVVPGDHIEKLKPETIAALNHVLAEPMEFFGYR